MKPRVIKSIFLSLLVTSYYLLVASSASAATLYFYPQNIALVPGQDALIDIRIDTAGEVINAVELEGAISGVAATLRSIDSSGSAIDIFVERPNVEGRSMFRLVGGIPAGLSGEHILARLVVRGELAGAGTLSFKPTTKILLADGTGASAKTSFIDANIAVAPKSKDYVEITSLTHPDQNQWYAATTASIRFEFDSSATYSYLVTLDPLAEPDTTPDRPEGDLAWAGETKLEGLPDGITYFAVRKVGSQLVSRYRLMNDNVAPIWLEVGKSEGTIETEGRPFLNFLAEDATSGISHYEMRIDGGQPYVVSSPAPLPDEYHILSIRAYDQAGNYIEEFIPGPQKDFTLWVWAAILFVLIVWMSGIISVRK